MGGMVEPPAREVPDHDCVTEVHLTDNVGEVHKQPATMPVCIITEDTPETDTDHMAEIPTDDLAQDPDNIFTHATEPFKCTCVKEIQRQVKVGNDLMDVESAQVQALIAEFMDMFALLVTKVKQVEGAVHQLNTEPDTKFSTKVHQKPLTPLQYRYLHEKLQGMLDKPKTHAYGMVLGCSFGVGHGLLGASPLDPLVHIFNPSFYTHIMFNFT